MMIQHNKERMDRVRSQKAAALMRYHDIYSRCYDIPENTIVLLLEDADPEARRAGVHKDTQG